MAPRRGRSAASSQRNASAKRARSEEASNAGPGRDYFSELPLELLKAIRSWIPRFAPPVNEKNEAKHERVWWRDLCLLQLSSRWFWIVVRAKYRSIQVEFGNLVPLLEAMRASPKLCDVVEVLKVYFHFAAPDITTRELWGADSIQFPIWRDLPSVRDRVFADRRKLLKVHWPTWHECSPGVRTVFCNWKEGENPCPLHQHRAKGTSGWPFQSPSWVYTGETPVAKYLPTLDRSTDDGGASKTLTDGPTGEGPIPGISSWEDWFDGFTELVRLCRPHTLVWDNPLTPIAAQTVQDLADLECIRALILGRQDVSSLHYQPLVSKSEFLRIQFAPPRPEREAWPKDRDPPELNEDLSPPLEPWVGTGMALPNDLIDDAPPGSQGHVLFTLLRSTDGSRLRKLYMAESDPPTTAVYQSPGLLPVLLAVPDLLEEQDPEESTRHDDPLAIALHVLRAELNEAAATVDWTPLTPAKLQQLVDSQPACQPIAKAVSVAADEICSRFNRRPADGEGGAPQDLEELMVHQHWDHLGFSQWWPHPFEFCAA